MYHIDALPSSIYLGRQTEKGVNEVRIDCAAWFDLWPSLTISAWATRSGESAAYPVMIEMDGTQLVWPISEADTALAGVGKLEIMGLTDTQRKLSAVVGTFVRESLIGGEITEPPEAAQPWVDKVLDAAEQVAEYEKNSVQTVNSKKPDENGDIDLSADDVGALPKTGGTVNGHIQLGDLNSTTSRKLYFRNKVNGSSSVNSAIGTNGNALQIQHVVRTGTTEKSNTITIDANQTRMTKPIVFADSTGESGTRSALNVYSKSETESAIARYTNGKFIEAESDPTVPDWAKQESKPTYTADEVGAVSKEALPEAIESALADAKENGEFDGPQGLPGKDGVGIEDITVESLINPNNKNVYEVTFKTTDGRETSYVVADGTDGRTPIKGLDYTDGAPGPGITDLTITERTDFAGRRYHQVFISWEEAQNGSIIKAGQTFNVYDGDKGEKGDSGVHIGTDEPTDPDVNVWINPEGDLLLHNGQQAANIYPMVTFVDDDGHADVLTKLKPLSETYGIPFTIAIPSVRIADTTGTWLTADDLLELQAMGWEISSHTHNHVKLGELTDEEAEEEMKTSKETLEAAGLKVTSICYPNSSVNDNTYKIAMKYYECGRRTNYHDQINTSPLQTWDLRTIPIGSYFTTSKLTNLDTSSLEYYKWAVDQAVANNGWLIFLTHCNEHDSVQQGYIEETIQYIQSLNIPVVTLTEGARIRKNRFEVGRVLYEDNTLPHFAVGCDGTISMTNGVVEENHLGGTLDAAYNKTSPKGALARYLIKNDGMTHVRPDGNGILFTDRTQNSEYYTYQYYFVGYKNFNAPHIYVRQWNPVDRVWTDFVSLTERAGTSEYRNLASTPKYVGACIFDTTLGKPVWYNGTDWVDATGAIV